MGRFYTPDFLERVQAEAEIVSIISGYIPLKQAGRNLKALCPFHQEKTPSFMVSPEKQIYHCFGCGAGGGVISFVKDYERVDFPEAVRILAEKVGLPLPEVKEDNQQTSIYSTLRKINEAAEDYYHQRLFSAEGQNAFVYLQKRGLTKEIITDFKLGYALSAWEDLLSYLLKKGFGRKDIERAGLILPRESGGYYDRFRNRIMFPIFDIRGRVVGFGGRIFGQNGAEAKYINSPQTEIFDKGRILYGLDKAKQEVTKEQEVIIVEGYLDLIACFRAGVLNSAATLGTALTSDHLKTLARYCRTIVMIYDSDKAGESAALRGLDLALEHDLQVRLVNLPAGYDPDSFLSGFGRAALVTKIKDAQTLFDYRMMLLRQKYNLASVEDRAAVAREMLPTISKISNQVLKSGYIRKLAGVLSVSEDSVISELNKIEKGKNARIPWEQQVEPRPGLPPLEEGLISLMVDDIRAALQVKKTVSLNDFTDPATRLIVSKIFELSEKGIRPSCAKLISLVDDEKIGQILSRTLLKQPQIAEGIQKQKEINNCLANLNKRKLRLKLGELKKKIKEVESGKDQEQLNQLLKEYQDLSRSVHKP